MELAIAITLDFWIFSKFQVEVERKLVKLHFLSFSQIPKMVILKVRIQVDQCTSTFGMHGPLAVKNCHTQSNTTD